MGNQTTFLLGASRHCFKHLVGLCFLRMATESPARRSETLMSEPLSMSAQARLADSIFGFGLRPEGHLKNPIL